MKTIRLLLGLAALAIFGAAASAHDKSAPLNDDQKAFLSQYEAVRAALAADDLAAVKTAASAVGTTPKTPPAEPLTEEQKDRQEKFTAVVKKIATADSLKTARAEFKALSKRAIHYAEGKVGYFVANCPMVEGGEGDWVQTSKKISNPYFGKAMLTCGSIK
eukprot:TRINITY_DN16592_c0_g1_i1.p3 TRINITY_DN16592_c0_g1~~TRINITY_DN16592_c0_g1_i1.p3  ORF type:complete len:161 (+),score=34.70 TRINITY_DN16592_c0_g1_i1:1312-1794(+)